MDTPINTTSTWQALLKHYQTLSKTSISDLFKADKERFNKYSCQAGALFLDYSKSLVDDETFKLLMDLAYGVDLKQHLAAMVSGEKINTTEKRPVLHTALRNLDPKASLVVDGQDIMPEIRAVLVKMAELVEKVRSGKWLGCSGKPITDIVNIGIGGSDLGPLMAVKALTPYCFDTLHYHFVANVDASQIVEVFKRINPATTLFIVASKTFTTTETLRNASSARDFLLEKTGMPKEDLQKHFVAVTANPKRAIEFGIAEKNIFPFWDWVGGRYSLWSALGLIIAIAIGMDNFKKFLSGARRMDEHFVDTPLEKNMPVILALLSIWYGNFCGASSYAILPYDQYLEVFPKYLQQLEMESNGKSVTLDGAKVKFKTAPIVWGSPGTNGQHAFHQLLMQGTELVPVDFILPAQSLNPLTNHHALLIANCLAQSKALMEGKNASQVRVELEQQGLSEDEIAKLLPHKLINGNVPSNTIILPKVTPETLGSLIALYEHKVFVAGVILGINSFDQWGVELGKKLAKALLANVEAKQGDVSTALDASTQGLIKLLKRY